MSMEKGIAHGKEKRKPYYRSGRFDRTCRPGGSCPYCVGNRLHSVKIRKLATEQQIEEALS